LYYYCIILSTKLNSVAWVRVRIIRLSAKLMPTFADGGFYVVSVTNPYGRILCFRDRVLYYTLYYIVFSIIITIITQMLQIDLFCTLCVCSFRLCLLCNWPLDCLLSTQMNENWIELNWIGLDWTIGPQHISFPQINFKWCYFRNKPSSATNLSPECRSIPKFLIALFFPFLLTSRRFSFFLPLTSLLCLRLELQSGNAVLSKSCLAEYSNQSGLTEYNSGVRLPLPI
jgi:hypothetical protein